MYAAPCHKPTTLWITGFKWVPKPRCLTKKNKDSYWKCEHLLKPGKRDNKHPQKVENMSMEEKVTLPKKLTKSLLNCMVQAKYVLLNAAVSQLTV